MKILLDEPMPIQFKKELQDYDVHTVRESNWLGVLNGELLKLAVENNFTVFLTCDKNLKHQQNLSRFNLIVIVINAVSNDIQFLLPLVRKIKLLLDDIINLKVSETYFE